MTTHFHSESLAYDGSALRSHWARRTFGLEGDAAVAFVGPCDVDPSHVADMDEVLSGEPIRSERMVHFLVEHFGPGLGEGVLLGRLLVALAFERLCAAAGPALRRRGDDLFLGDRKLSVSVATVTPVSVKIHFGVNVTGKGAPVKAAGLSDLGVDPAAFAGDLLAAYAAEIESAHASRTKVRGVE
jgi:hypothetical protein